MKVGIDKISFYTPLAYLSLQEWARGRGLVAEKYQLGLGQQEMSIAAPSEDCITMAAQAALPLFQDDDSLKSEIDLVLFATESSFDYAKAASLFIHDLFKLSPQCRTIELKQACYAGVFALQTAISYIRSGQAKCVLVLASDIARYAVGSAAESSQGAGGVAFIVRAEPKILAIEPYNCYLSMSAKDFYRPIPLREPIVDGQYSCALYLQFWRELWGSFQEKYPSIAISVGGFCFHTPIPRLSEKALSLATSNPDHQELLKKALIYPRRTGNTYTASLFISLCSLLENNDSDLAYKRIAFYSYGSGACAEVFSGEIQPSYHKFLLTNLHQSRLQKRQELSYKLYKNILENGAVDLKIYDQQCYLDGWDDKKHPRYNWDPKVIF